MDTTTRRRETAHARIVRQVVAELERHAWLNIEVTESDGVLAGRFAAIHAESEPNEFLLNTHISIYVGARSVRGGHLYGIATDREIAAGRFGWSSAVSAYASTKAAR